MTQEDLFRLASQVGEHWDAVQILVTRIAEEGGTERYFVGSGNWYARQGMAHAFIKLEEANQIGAAIERKEGE